MCIYFFASRNVASIKQDQDAMEKKEQLLAIKYNCEKQKANLKLTNPKTTGRVGRRKISRPSPRIQRKAKHNRNNWRKEQRNWMEGVKLCSMMDWILQTTFQNETTKMLDKIYLKKL